MNECSSRAGISSDAQRPASASRPCVAASRDRAQARTAGAAAFRAEGEARHLPVPVGRAVADGAVRLQAAARPSSRAPICRIPSAWGSG